ILGSGAFGVVFKGEFPNGIQVAVKAITNHSNKQVEEQFMAEVGSIGRTYHINLVRLYGFCLDSSKVALVYEFMENGSLDRFLFDKNQDIEWKKLHDIAVGTAKGLAYLHEECQEIIIHYDIKPGNILVDSNLHPKVADFGLAKLCNREINQITMTGLRGTPGYAAPELWKPYPVTHKCDIYSFGMVLFEIVGRRRNHNLNLSESQQWLPRWTWDMFINNELAVLLSLHGIEEKDREKAERMAKVALWCVQYSPEARPLMSTVVKMLEGGMEIPQPPNPFEHLEPNLAFNLGSDEDYSTSASRTNPSTADSQVEHATMERFLSNMAREKPIRFSPQQLSGLTNNYATILGSGAFGVVFKGEFPNGIQVAVKAITNHSNKQVEEQFMAEVGSIGRTYHINLVRLYGFCLDSSKVALVYEFMENGSLDRFLFDKNQDIEWKKLHDIAVGTAKGLAYLHEECQEIIIHYDIKPGNILVDSNLHPKVADFGLAKLCNREINQITMTGLRGTPGYAAPELWKPYPVTHKCDIYSFGMVLFEIVGRRRNHNLNLSESQQWLPRWTWDMFINNELAVLLSLHGIEEKDREKAERMAKVALWCVQYSPEARPLMSTVVKMLEG
ncbi:Pkinase domain-containing protein, partial [Cephalotus follicularis]